MTIEATPATSPIETVTPIKPSEAIRLGCLIAPEQAFGNYIVPSGAACALGAMALGWDGVVSIASTNRAHDAVGLVANRDCPETGCRSAAWVPHLNDDHLWSRERIAAWLEGLGL